MNPPQTVISNTNTLLRSEVLWLVISLVFTVVFSLVLFGKGVFSGNLDIHVHDTYFVTPSYLILSFLFIVFTFILFYFKSGNIAYRTSTSFGITCICGSVIVLIMTILALPVATFLGVEGATFYPPLSTLGDAQVSGFRPGLPFWVISGFFLLMAILVLMLTIIKAYKWGGYRNGN